MPKRVPDTGVRVLAVEPGGLADRAGLRPGDRLLRINGHALRDLIDFHLETGEERLGLELERADQRLSLVIRREWGKDLGLECEPPRPAEISTCANKCVFCFIHQLPKGLRRSLYVKDDDYRLSFLHGNYITLTDLPDEEIERIVAQRLSPLYISVHATDSEVRHVLLGNPKGVRADLVERMRRLAEAGIRMHAQIVLCPGLNDGPHLERSLRDLAALHPGVATVAVVPVGLTRHREGLPALRAVTPEDARGLLERVHAWQRTLQERLGTRFVFAADELYIQGGILMPAEEAYEGYPIAEDGVGLVRRFVAEFERARGERPRLDRPAGWRVRSVTVVTGELFAPILRGLVADLTELRQGARRPPGLRVEVVPVPNEFFGRAISVAGLLTAGDIARALAGRALGELVLVPGVALRETGGVFLDDATPADLSRELGVPVATPEATAGGLLEALLGGRAVRSA